MSADSLPSTESNQADMLPLIKDSEEDIARYGQMVTWLRTMARFTKDMKEKEHLTALWRMAISEFVLIQRRKYSDLFKALDSHSIESVENAYKQRDANKKPAVEDC